ncbi:MAG: hypothetical protein NWQ38_02925, partial [Cellulophaga sp.]|nr:hypothetical protein [Cellulophaga sp.]
SVTNYPELPPMPPAPPKVKKGETNNIPPPPLAPASPKVKKGETSNIPPPPPPPPFHKGEVSKSLESAYNSWVKTLKNADGSYNIITKEEYRYFSSIYENMTNEQQNNAELMPPPPPPSATKVLKGEVSNIPPPPPASPRVKKGEVTSIPPPPPAPKSPLDHVIDMAKKGAIFYYENEEISAEIAIDLLKKNKNLDIDTKYSGSKQPIIRISKEPIKLPFSYFSLK